MQHDNTPYIAHPHQEALIQVGVLLTFFAVIVLVVWYLSLIGMIDALWNMLAIINMAVWLFIWGTIWLLSTHKRRMIYDLLASDRPLVRWHYTQDEWCAIQAAYWQEQQMGWLPIGCLSTLFGIAGLSVGAAIGFDDDGIAGAVMWGVVGMVAGAVPGAIFGGLTIIGNKLSSYWATQNETTALVAFSPHEILHGRNYFRSNHVTKHITAIHLNTQQDPAMMVVQIYNLKIRGNSNETWRIAVPHRMLDAVQQAIPHIVITSS